MKSLETLVQTALAARGPIVFLTGAGISAESGIPTFRGPEGYWKVGSKNYRAEELATYEAFQAMPDEVWAWYLFRRGVCRAAAPNPAHLALVEAERLLGDRFLLLTQNVDGLHLRAGNTLARTYQVHGNIDYCRCTPPAREDGGPSPPSHPPLGAPLRSASSLLQGAPLEPPPQGAPGTRLIPSEIDIAWAKDRKLTKDEIAILKCCKGGWSRPHVLWFDESYDEPLFRFESSLQASLDAAMLIVVGTSGATTLPTYVVAAACKRNIPLVCINMDPSPFTQQTAAIENGLVLLGPAGEHMPRVLDALRASRA
ncbi:MAG: RNA polymerase subunit sigma [Deltaproteobacteria bacterium]|nr:RNA polymerase subunit sigma [Deltaproteobacteria bacterium]